MSPTPPPVLLTGFEVTANVVISVVYLTLGVVHHHRTKDWICLLYFVLAAAVAGLACVALIHLWLHLGRRPPTDNPGA